MAVRFDLSQFLTNFGNIGAAAMAGRIAGRQQREAQELQRFQLAQQLASQETSRQAEMDRLTLSQNLSPESKATVLGGMYGRPSPNAGLVNDPYAKRTGILASMPGLGGVPQPSTMPDARSFQTPHGMVSLTGIDPKEATRIMTGIDKSLGDMRAIQITDPNTAALRDELFRQRAAMGPIDTPEKLQAANILLQSVLNFQSRVGGPTVQAREAADLRTNITEFEQEFEKGNTGLDDYSFASTLPGWLQREKDIRKKKGAAGYGGKGLTVHEKEIAEIERRIAAGDEEGATRLGREIRGRISNRVTAQQEAKGVAEITRMIGKWSPREATPENVRKLYQTYDGGRYAYLVEGVPDNLLGQGGSALEKNWQSNFEILTNPKRWAGLPKPARMQVLEEISGAATMTGRDLNLPADMVLEATEEEKLKLAQLRDRVKLTGTQLERANVDLAFLKAKFDWWQKHPESRPGAKGAAKGSELTQNAKAQAYRKVWEKSWADYDRLSKELKTTTADFDPLNPDMKDTDQVALSRLYKAALQAGNQYKAFLGTQGVDIDLNLGVGGTREKSDKAETARMMKEMQDQAARAKPGAPPGRPDTPPAKPLIRPFQTNVPTTAKTLAQRKAQIDQDGRSMATLYQSIQQRQANQQNLTPEQVAQLGQDIDRYNQSREVYNRNVGIYNEGARAMQAVTGSKGTGRKSLDQMSDEELAKSFAAAAARSLKKR